MSLSFLRNLKPKITDQLVDMRPDSTSSKSTKVLPVRSKHEDRLLRAYEIVPFTSSRVYLG